MAEDADLTMARAHCGASALDAVIRAQPRAGQRGLGLPPALR